MSRSWLGVSFVVGVLFLASVGTPVVATDGSGTNVQISSVSVTPDDPTTGDRVTLETKISNLESSSETIEVADIYVRASGSAQSHGRLQNVGSVGPGGSITVPLSATFDSPGEKTLTVRAVIEDESGDRQTYEYPVSIDVADPTVKTDLSVQSPANRSDVTEVELTNYGNVNVSDVEVAAAVDGDVVARHPMHDLEPESSRTVRFDTEALSGKAVTFTATYTAAGDAHETVTTETVDEPVEGEIRLTGIEATVTGTDVTISGDAANIGSTDTESVIVSVQNGDGVRPVSPSGEYFIGPVDASEFATFELTAALENGTSSVPVEIAYIVDGDRITTTQRIDVNAAGASVASVEGQAPDAPGGESSGFFGGVSWVLIGVLVVVVGGLYYAWNRE
ncbi:hypothetical protein [Halopiger djelfimassiliensis]|uniref:hypothetical protein n=1 Tax=Halopiger djelfimassiliensis TaxID=1293047 RepID=UPI001E2E4FBD|nr:hypothetical protein [Halopiger djelfimassiliensis]